MSDGGELTTLRWIQAVIEAKGYRIEQFTDLPASDAELDRLRGQVLGQYAEVEGMLRATLMQTLGGERREPSASLGTVVLERVQARQIVRMLVKALGQVDMPGTWWKRLLNKDVAARLEERNKLAHETFERRYMLARGATRPELMLNIDEPMLRAWHQAAVDLTRELAKLHIAVEDHMAVWVHGPTDPGEPPDWLDGPPDDDVEPPPWLEDDPPWADDDDPDQ